MNSKVIKFVAGAGKTTYSEKYMKENKNGIYLAFNNSVVNELKNKGYLCKTIDSLFSSFIIPKFTSVIPLIATGAKVNFIDIDEKPQYLKGIANIKIQEDGKIYNRTKDTKINLNIENETLHEMENFPNSRFIKNIFAKDSLNISNQQRAELSNFIIENYPDETIEILRTRFSYIIIDEAQDLKGYREKFAKLIYESDIEVILLGDNYQNINGGGKWFERVNADETEETTFRCSEKICKWIRDNLNINIYGNDSNGEYKNIELSKVLDYDNGQRTLLYNSNSGKNKEIIGQWKGKKQTIKKAKGSTIEEDIIIIGQSLNFKNLYTAITRTKRNAYSSVHKINFKEE